MKYFTWLFASALLLSCAKEKKGYKPQFNTVTATTLHEQQDIGVRAVTNDGDKVWYAGSMGNFGALSINGGKALSGVISKDTLYPEFRSIAQTKDAIFILNAGTPALLYKVTKDSKHNKLVYTEAGEKVFYDSMKFRNDKEGIAIGDPVNECLSVITTKDGGETWRKVSCIKLPAVEEGEACFAASNTNLVVRGDKTWIISGGKKSRVFYSTDKGGTWKVYDTPILQGEAPTGMFSVDFYDDEVGFAVGGDYTDAKGNKANKILTEDGGKTWKLMADGTAYGYSSCVQFVPNSKGNGLITVGPSGVWYSYDRGTTWKKIHDEKSFHTIRFVDTKTAIVAGQNSIVRLNFK
jgi:photosystem II stability/assembly factor-like uncharacterized protein